jgi:hypothetical protein
MLAVLFADDSAIPALRALDPHLRPVVGDVLGSNNKGLHVFDRTFDVRPPARLKGERIEIGTSMLDGPSLFFRLVDFRFRIASLDQKMEVQPHPLGTLYQHELKVA